MSNMHHQDFDLLLEQNYSVYSVV